MSKKAFEKHVELLLLEIEVNSDIKSLLNHLTSFCLIK